MNMLQICTCKKIKGLIKLNEDYVEIKIMHEYYMYLEYHWMPN